MHLGFSLTSSLLLDYLVKQYIHKCTEVSLICTEMSYVCTEVPHRCTEVSHMYVGMSHAYARMSHILCLYATYIYCNFIPIHMHSSPNKL